MLNLTKKLLLALILAVLLFNIVRFGGSGLVISNSTIRIKHKQAFQVKEEITSETGVQAPNDNFPVAEYASNKIDYVEVEDFEFTYGRVDPSSIQVDPDMTYKNSFTELPLYFQDYYYRKYENAMAGVNGLNKMPILKPGDNVGVIRDKYINVKAYNGFVQPPGYYFGSGLCWSTTTLGIMMDNANKDFQAKYGIPLFTFKSGDRAPHSTYYKTYHGYGYTVLQISTGVAAQDYRFTINPAIKNKPELADLKIKIVLVGTRDHDWGAYGQSVGAYILSNKDF